MRKLIAGLICLGLGIIAGCSGSTPGELLRPAPMDESAEAIRDQVHNSLPPGARLILPGSQGSSAIQQLDLDQDQQPEILAFYRKYKEMTVGILIFPGDGSPAITVEGPGSEVDYVGLAEIDGQGLPELLLGWSGGSDLPKSLNIYRYENKQLANIAEQLYDSLATGDLDQDGTDDLVVSQREFDEYRCKVSWLAYKKGQLQMIDSFDLEALRLDLSIARAGANRTALFIDGGLGAHSAFTDLRIPVVQHLQQVLPVDENGLPTLTFQPYPVGSQDINGDGIMEIGNLKQPQGYEDAAMVEIPWITQWFQWDGKNGLNLVLEQYGNYGYGFTFDFPANWRDRITIKKTESEQYFRVDFVDTRTGADYVGIVCCEVKLRNEVEEQLKEKGKTVSLLGEHDGYTFFALLPGQKDASYGLDAGETEQRFKIIEER